MSLPSITTALIVYVGAISPVTTTLESTLASVAVSFTFAVLNMLMSNTPILAQHAIWSLLAVLNYVVTLLVYENVTGRRVYAQMQQAGQLAWVVLIQLVAHMGWVLVWVARARSRADARRRYLVKVEMLKACNRNVTIWVAADPPQLNRDGA